MEEHFQTYVHGEGRKYIYNSNYAQYNVGYLENPAKLYKEDKINEFEKLLKEKDKQYCKLEKENKKLQYYLDECNKAIVELRDTYSVKRKFEYRMNKIIKKQVLATFALVTIMAGVLIGTNCIYAAQDGKETTTIRLINQTYFNVKNIKVTWNDGKEQTVNTLGSHDSIDFSSDAGSVYKMDVTGTTQSGEKFTGHFKGLVGKDTRVFIELDENADVQVFIPQGEID